MCLNSLINSKNPSRAIHNHFSIHHTTGDFFHIMVEGSRNQFFLFRVLGPGPAIWYARREFLEAQTSGDTAAAIRRRQRLRPGPAGRGRSGIQSRLAGPEIGVEKLLFGPDGGDKLQSDALLPSTPPGEATVEGSATQETRVFADNSVGDLRSGSHDETEPKEGVIMSSQ